MTGKFTPKDPQVRILRAQKGKANSPWARSPACLTRKAHEAFKVEKGKK